MAGRHQDRVGFDGGDVTALLVADHGAVRAVADADDSRAGGQHDPLLAQDVRGCLDDVVVLGGHDLREGLQHGHLGAELAVHPGEFDPDVASAKDDQSPGQVRNVENLRAGHRVPAGSQAGNVRDDGLGASVDHYGVRRDSQPVVPGGYLDGLRVHERGPASDHGHGVDHVQQLEVLLAQESGQVVGAADGLAVPLSRDVAAWPRFGLVYQGLCRYAADVDAGSAIHAVGLLDHCHVFALPAHRGGQCLAALAEAQDENVNVHRVHASTLIRRCRSDKA